MHLLIYLQAEISITYIYIHILISACNLLKLAEHCQVGDVLRAARAGSLLVSAAWILCCTCEGERAFILGEVCELTEAGFRCPSNLLPCSWGLVLALKHSSHLFVRTLCRGSEESRCCSGGTHVHVHSFIHHTFQHLPLGPSSAEGCSVVSRVTSAGRCLAQQSCGGAPGNGAVGQWGSARGDILIAAPGMCASRRTSWWTVRRHRLQKVVGLCKILDESGSLFWRRWVQA